MALLPKVQHEDPLWDKLIPPPNDDTLCPHRWLAGKMNLDLKAQAEHSQINSSSTPL